MTEEEFSSENNKMAEQRNHNVKHVVKNHISLRVPKLNLGELKFIRFSDSSFSHSHELSSQLGYVCYFADETGAAVTVSFKLYKARRVSCCAT